MKTAQNWRHNDRFAGSMGCQGAQAPAPEARIMWFRDLAALRIWRQALALRDMIELRDLVTAAYALSPRSQPPDRPDSIEPDQWREIAEWAWSYHYLLN